MADNTLQFETRVDLSGLNSGMAQASTTVNKFGSDTKTAMAAAAQATKQLADAQIQLGQAASQGNAQAAAIIATYKAQVTEANAAVRAMSESEQELTVSTERANTAMGHQVSMMAAASGEIRLLEGKLPIRAVENFLSKTLQLGPVMQAAFPVFGAIALGEVLVETGAKAYGLYQEFLTLKVAGEDLAKGLAADGDKIANSWGKTLGLMHTQGMRDNPIGTLKTDVTDITYSIQGLEAKAANAKTALQNALSVRAGGNYYGHGTSEEANDQEVLGLQSRLRTYESEIGELKARIANAQSEITKKEDKPEKKGPDPQIQQLRDLEEALNKAKINAQITAQEETDYWQDNLHFFRDGSTQYESILSKIVAARHAAADEFGKDVMKEIEDNQRQIDIEQHVSDELEKTYTEITHQEQQAQKAQDEFNAVMAKAQEISSHNTAAMELATVAQDKAFGSATALGAAHMTAAIHAQEYADKLAALRAQLEAINAETPTTQAGVSSQEQRSLAVTNQIQQTKGQQQVSAIGDTTAQAQAMASPFLKAFDDINNGFLSVTNKMIMGTQSISRDFAQMGAQLVVSTADAFEKMLAKSVQFEIQSLLAHQVTNTSKVTSDTAAAAATTTISAQSSLMQVAHEAAVAAAGAWAALSGIPVIGPVLGAAAAGVTYAGVMALAAFETGGIIPNTGIAMVHQGEAVLPKGITDFIMKSSSTSNSATANMTNNNYGMSDSGFRKMATRNAEHMVATVHSGLRKMGRA